MLQFGRPGEDMGPDMFTFLKQCQKTLNPAFSEQSFRNLSYLFFHSANPCEPSMLYFIGYVEPFVPEELLHGH
jgi:hypothetical protein